MCIVFWHRWTCGNFVNREELSKRCPPHSTVKRFFGLPTPVCTGLMVICSDWRWPCGLWLRYPCPRCQQVGHEWGVTKEFDKAKTSSDFISITMSFKITRLLDRLPQTVVYVKAASIFGKTHFSYLWEPPHPGSQSTPPGSYGSRIPAKVWRVVEPNHRGGYCDEYRSVTSETRGRDQRRSATATEVQTFRR